MADLKNYKKNNIKKAFTLAEVLLVITIIGIIASMTVPALIHDIQDTQLKTRWRKAYAILSEATDQIREDNGGTCKGVWYNGGSVIPVYRKYINIIEVCAWPQAALNNCWASTTTSPSVAGAVLNDGMFIQVDGDLNCMFGCAGIIVDVNGKKGPNTCGEDIFKFDVSETREAPSGAPGSFWMPDACWSNSSKVLTQ